MPLDVMAGGARGAVVLPLWGDLDALLWEALGGYPLVVAAQVVVPSALRGNLKKKEK